MELKHITENDVASAIALVDALNSAFPEEGEIVAGDEKAVAEMIEYYRSPERQALENFLEELSLNKRAELVALMWFGRGDSDDLPALTEQARKHPDQKSQIGYVADKAPVLAEYWKDGLAKL